MVQAVIVDVPHQEGLLAEASRFGTIDVVATRLPAAAVRLTIDISAPDFIIGQLATELQSVASRFRRIGGRMTVDISIGLITADSLQMLIAQGEEDAVWIRFQQGAARIHFPNAGPSDLPRIATCTELQPQLVELEHWAIA